MSLTPELTQTRLMKLLDYEPNTGRFRWRLTRGGTARAGTIAGWFDSRGRHQITIDQKNYFASRLAFLWMAGRWPRDEIDHRNRDCRDNRWRNLREANRVQNMGNTSVRASNRIGVKGIRRVKDRYRAGIMINYKHVHLGYFDTSEEASDAYRKAANDNFGEFASTG